MLKERLTAKMNIAFTEKTAEAIKELAAQAGVKPSEIIRECVRNDLPKLRERIRKRKK